MRPYHVSTPSPLVSGLNVDVNLCASVEIVEVAPMVAEALDVARNHAWPPSEGLATIIGIRVSHLGCSETEMLAPVCVQICAWMFASLRSLLSRNLGFATM